MINFKSNTGCIKALILKTFHLVSLYTLGEDGDRTPRLCFARGILFSFHSCHTYLIVSAFVLFLCPLVTIKSQIENYRIPFVQLDREFCSCLISSAKDVASVAHCPLFLWFLADSCDHFSCLNKNLPQEIFQESQIKPAFFQTN